MDKPKVGSLLLVEGSSLVEATILQIAEGMDCGTCKTYYKIKDRSRPHRVRWISEYYVKGVLQP